MRTQTIVTTLITIGLLAACSGSTERDGLKPGGAPGDQQEDPGTVVQLECVDTST